MTVSYQQKGNYTKTDKWTMNRKGYILSLLLRKVHVFQCYVDDFTKEFFVKPFLYAADLRSRNTSIGIEKLPKIGLGGFLSPKQDEELQEIFKLSPKCLTLFEYRRS